MGLAQRFIDISTRYFQGGKNLTRDGKNADGPGLGQILKYERARMRGVVPGARVAFSVNPTANDTITIGGIAFKFVAALGAAGVAVQVLIGADAAHTLASLISAINGVTSDATWVEASTPFAAAVVADAVTATVLRLRGAEARGGLPTPAPSASIALAAAVTGGAAAWNVANLNAAGGKNMTDQDIVRGKVAITAAMITAGSFDVELPIAATGLLWDGYSSAGVKRAVNEAVTLVTEADGSVHVHLVFAGGASPNWQATDVFSFAANV